MDSPSLVRFSSKHRAPGRPPKHISLDFNKLRAFGITGASVGGTLRMLRANATGMITLNQNDRIELPKGTLITLFEATLYYPIPLRKLRRAIAKGTLIPRGTRKMPSGQIAQTFFSEEVELLIERQCAADTTKLAQRFFENCLNVGCIPLSVLHHIFSSEASASVEHRENCIDVDVAYASIRLVLEGNNCFLECIHGEQFPNDGSFPAELAQFLGPSEELNIRYWRETPGVDNYEFFEHMYGLYQRDLTESGVAQRNLEYGSRPAYLRHLKCSSVPDWALAPVWPIVQTGKTKAVIRRVEGASSSNPALQLQLPEIIRSIADLSPVFGPPSEDVETRDPAAAAGMLPVISHLATLLADEDLATDYCWAMWRLIHHDKIRAIKLSQGENWMGSAPPESIPAVVVARVFGAKV